MGEHFQHSLNVRAWTSLYEVAAPSLFQLTYQGKRQFPVFCHSGKAVLRISPQIAPFIIAKGYECVYVTIT
jgi:hypothetical protein